MGDDDRKLFVGRLPDDIQEGEIWTIFKTYGPVSNVKILDKGAQKAAFVTYDTKYAADVAVQVLNDVYRFRTDARDPIHVSLARSGGASRSSSRSDQGPPPHLSAASPYGHPGGCGGYGGGCYGYGPSYAYGGGFPGYGYDQGGYDHRHDTGGGGGGAQGSKVYVANLPEDITKDALEYVFRTYGRLQNVHIMESKAKNGRIAAFVFYTNPDEARKCIAAMKSGYEIRPGQGDIQVKYASDQRPPNSGPRS